MCVTQIERENNNASRNFAINENVAYGPRIHGITNNRGELDELVGTSLRKSGLWKEVKDWFERRESAQNELKPASD